MLKVVVVEAAVHMNRIIQRNFFDDAKARYDWSHAKPGDSAHLALDRFYLSNQMMIMDRFIITLCKITMLQLEN